MSFIVDRDPPAAERLRMLLGSAWTVLPSMAAVRHRLLAEPQAQTLVVGPEVPAGEAFALAAGLRVTRPDFGVLLIRRQVDADLLAQALRAGVREVVADGDGDGLQAAAVRCADLARALREQADAAGEPDPEPRARVVTVFSAKGGCGKTTVATNLAALLADGGRRQVCLLDLDLAFGDVAISLQLFPAHTLADAVPLTDQLDQAAVAGLITPHSPGLSTLVAPLEPGLAETIPAATVAAVLRLLRQMYDYVVVDTPPAFTDHVLGAFDESDLVVLLATLDVPALKNLKITLETLDLLNYPRERWRIAVNRADSKVGLSLGEVAKTLGAPIALQIPSSRAVPAAVNRGVPLVLDSPDHPVSQALREFARQHVLAVPAAHRTGPRAGGLWRRVRR